jgi:hypothetical protein
MDAPGLGERLQSGRDVRRVAHRVVPARVVAERRDHQGPAVDADPNPRALGHLAPGDEQVALDPVPHSQTREHGPLGVVLDRPRQTQNHHEPVA